jgi:phosphonate transport system permease protein
MNQKASAPKARPPVHPALKVAVPLASVVLPGLGHALLGAWRRGLLLLVSLGTIVGLLAWRIRIVGRRQVGVVAMTRKAFELQPLLLAVAIGAALIYLWIILDSLRAARRPGARFNPALWGLVLVVYFALGWQIGEINLVTLATEAKDAAPFMQRIVWPWDRAIHREETLLIGEADVRIPCIGTPPAPIVPEPGQPSLVADPSCGDLSTQGGALGSTLTVTGQDFAPNTETEIWWMDELRNEFRQRQAGEYVKLTTDDQGAFQIDIIIPYRLIPPAEAGTYSTWTLQARQVASVGKAEPSEELLLAIEKMIETIFLGMMATVFGIVLSRLTLLLYYLTRTVLNIIRSIEPLIWAVIAIIVVGLGPFAGIVALTVHSIAALGKLYSEAIESIDPGPIEAIHATGANWLQTVVYGVVPQVIPPFVSFTIYRWDINVRMSTVIGLVGGGGIGFLLIQWIHLLDYKAAGIAVWFISITVAVLDYVSSEIRQRFV